MALGVISWREGVKDQRQRLVGVVRQGGDELFDIADLFDAEAEVFADFYGFAYAYGFVVISSCRGLVAAFYEFYDGAYS